MKKLIGLLSLLVLTVAHAATTVPVQLLNPAGSVAGQAIVSAGPSSAPAWGAITYGNLAQAAANTVLANTGSSTANLAAASLPSCSASTNALSYTSGTGFGCNSSINAATLSGATFEAPPAAGYGSSTPEPVSATTISATSAISPSQTAGIVGTTTNNNANAGSFGEYTSPTFSSVGMVSGTIANLTSVSLTAGDWDVEGNVIYATSGASANVTTVLCGINTTSSALPSFGNYAELGGLAVPTSSAASLICPIQRISIASTTTVYLVGDVLFSAGTVQATGFIRARRVR